MASKFVCHVEASQIHELESEFLASAMAQTHPKIHQWCGAALEANLREASSNAVVSLVDKNQARQFAEALHVLGLPAESFKGRLLEVDGVRLIAAINFRDISGATPYIRLLGATTAPGTISDWSTLKPCLADVFREFNPQAVMLFHPEHLPICAPIAGIEDHLLAAPVGEMVNVPPQAGFDRVDLRRSVSVDFYPRYQAIYEAVYAERPALRGEVRTESEDSLADCLGAGLLFEIYVDGKWCGVLAADRRTVAGIRGVYMVEIVLEQGARGQGLGPAVHQRLAAAVADLEPTDIIFGTIAAVNPWSRRTALRAGRVEIGAWHWVDL